MLPRLPSSRAECAAGYGKQGGSTQCTLCAAGTYAEGYNGLDTTGASGDGETCVACVPTMYVFQSSIGEEAPINSTGTTYRVGATKREECVPKFEQVGVDVGQQILLDNAMFSTDTSLSLAGCLAKCGPTAGKGCFVQFDYGYYNGNVSTCYYASLDANTDGVAPATGLLYVKQIPSDALGATSKVDPELKAKAMSSGMYARLNIPTAAAWALSNIGTALAGGTYSVSGAADLSAVKNKCDMNSRCWGFTLQGGQAVLRGGSDAADLRSFYYNPSDSTSLSWGG